jgi:hypothetical protein
MQVLAESNLSMLGDMMKSLSKRAIKSALLYLAACRLLSGIG